jgi:hypothetical protein
MARRKRYSRRSYSRRSVRRNRGFNRWRGRKRAMRSFRGVRIGSRM